MKQYTSPGIMGAQRGAQPVRDSVGDAGDAGDGVHMPGVLPAHGFVALPLTPHDGVGRSMQSNRRAQHSSHW